MNNDNEHEPQTDNQRQTRKSMAILHGWSLTFLYFSLTAWSLVIVYPLVKFDLLKLGGGDALPWLMLVGCLATLLSSLRAGRRFWQAMRRNQRAPSVDLAPFLAIAVTLTIAGRVFAAY